MQSKDDILKLIHSSAFQKMMKTKNRMVFCFSLLTLIAYCLFFIAIAWLPDWMGEPMFSAGIVSTGIWLAIFSVIFAVFISGIYTWWANKYFDKELQQVLQEAGLNEE
ncbi:MAG: DUF485 domain-containing protein [Gammaproteobacteria bacterium]|nr:DUF485 domain-containing protein [Gammaproteobacteria bacterium]